MKFLIFIRVFILIFILSETQLFAVDLYFNHLNTTNNENYRGYDWYRNDLGSHTGFDQSEGIPGSISFGKVSLLNPDNSRSPNDNCASLDCRMGNSVIVQYLRNNGEYIYALYAHLDDFNVSQDSFVVPDQKIGTLGSTDTDILHLHFEIKEDNMLGNSNVQGWGYIPFGGGTDLDPDEYGFHNPTDFMENENNQVAIPFLSSTVQNPSVINYDVYAIAKTQIFGALDLYGTFHRAAIVVRDHFSRSLVTDRGRLSDNLRFLGDLVEDQSIDGIAGSNDQYDAGNYLFAAYANNNDLRFGYPVKFTFLSSKFSKIVDNDQINSLTNEYEQSDISRENFKSGYFLTSVTAAGQSDDWARWKPHVSGYYKIFIHVPVSNQVTNVVYTIKPDGTNENQIFSQPIDHQGNDEWVQIVSDQDQYESFNFTTNGFIELELSSVEGAPNATISNEDIVSFDAIKFEYDIIKNALNWLESAQQDSGSWNYNVGHTAMITLAFLNAGYLESSEVVSKGIEYIISKKQSNGGIYDDSSNITYMTSLAILTLVATHNENYKDTIKKAQNLLLSIQNDDGGWGYYANSRSDMSNTQFPLMAFSAAEELSAGHNVWTKAIQYIDSRQQEDGGISYHPNYDVWASMTAAGIWSYRLCGVSENDQRVIKALEWLKNNDTNMTFIQNTSHNNSHRYYYYMSLAKALALSFLSPDQEGAWYENWYDKLKVKIASEQNEDGSWNVDGDGLYGDTAFALLALQSQQPPPADLWMSVILASPANLVVYDPQNNLCSENECTIQGANFEIDKEGKQICTLPEIEAGHYRFVLLGTDDGICHLTIKGYKSNPDNPESFIETNSIEKEVDIKKHEVIVSDALLSSITGALTIHVEEPTNPSDPDTGSSLPYDFDADNKISTNDFQRISSHWNSENDFFDIDNDGIVTVLDIMIVASIWTE